VLHSSSSSHINEASSKGGAPEDIHVCLVFLQDEGAHERDERHGRGAPVRKALSIASPPSLDGRFSHRTRTAEPCCSRTAPCEFTPASRRSLLKCCSVRGTRLSDGAIGSKSSQEGAVILLRADRLQRRQCSPRCSPPPRLARGHARADRRRTKPYFLCYRKGPISHKARTSRT
jgi:hypothetical protein